MSDEITSILRESLHYIQKYQEQLIAIYVDDNVIADIGKYEIVKDIIKLAQAGFKIIICYSRFDIELDWLDRNCEIKHFNFKDLTNLNAIHGNFLLKQVPLIYCEEDVFFNLIQAMNIRKLFFIGKSALFDTDNNLIRELDYSKMEKLLRSGIFSGIEDRIKLILNLPNREEYRIHFISGHREGSFLREILTCCGDGTMIYKNHAYHNICPAQLSDLSAINKIIEASNARGDLNLTSTQKGIKRNLKNFIVLTIDGELHVIAAIADQLLEQHIAKIEYLTSLNPYENMSAVINEFMVHLLKRLQLQDKKVSIVLERLKNTIWLGISPWFKELGFISCKNKADWQKQGLSSIVANPPLWILKEC